MFTHKTGVTYKSDAGTVTASTETFTGNAELAYDIVVPANTTNMQFNTEIDVSEIVSMVFVSDQDLTVHAGDGSSAGDGATVELTADIPRVWTTTSVENSYLTIDVEKFFITNAGDDAALLKVRILFDQ